MHPGGIVDIRIYRSSLRSPMQPPAALRDDAALLRQLDGETARRVESAQRISSFDALIASLVLASIRSSATTVTVNVLADKLQVCVVDNGASIRPDAWDSLGTTRIPQHPRSSVLHTAATFSTLHLYSSSSRSTKPRHRRKRIRAGNIVEDSILSAPPPRLHPHRGGVIVDVRDLFVNLPVRRKAALQMSQARVLQPLRSRIMAIALCNPSVSIRVNLLPTNETFFMSRARSVLKLESLSKALALRSNPTYLPVRARSETTSFPVTLSGFVAANALARPSDDAQIVAVNGVPLEHNARVHTLIRNAARPNSAHDLGRGGSIRVPFPHPAYVLNIKCDSQLLDVSAYEVGACIVGFHGLDVEKFVADQVSIVLHPDDEEGGTDAQSKKGETSCSESARDEADSMRAMQAEFGEYLKKTDDGVMGVVDENEADLTTPLSMRDALLKHSKKRMRVGAMDTECGCSVRRPLSAFEMRKKNGNAGRTRPFSSTANTSDGASIRPLSATRRLRRPQSAAAVMEGIAKTLPDWKNPCFKGGRRAPRSIFAARPGSAAGRDMDLQEVTVHRETLDGMRVIGQVDRKFIITVDNASGTLYAVDQHAASERAHFERLLDEARTRHTSKPLKQPLVVSLSAAHHAALNAHRSAVQRWGWRLEEKRNNAGRYTFRILAVPAVASAEVRLDAARDLLNYLEGLGDGGEAEHNMVPKPLVNALASVACHGAVRFGDSLTHGQCAALLSGMAQCESPFTCAHGRPSIVPLAVLKGSAT